MIGFLLGISITINVLLIVLFFVYLKIKNKTFSQMNDLLSFNKDEINDQDLFKDFFGN